MKRNKKADTANIAIERPERLTLSESRNILYEKFRTNLRILRGQTNISGVELSKEIGLESGARITNLEYGRATPSMEEVICIASYFNVSLDEIINKQATILFK